MSLTSYQAAPPRDLEPRISTLFFGYATEIFLTALAYHEAGGLASPSAGRGLECLLERGFMFNRTYSIKPSSRLWQ
jgi:hypothetical protein